MTFKKVEKRFAADFFLCESIFLRVILAYCNSHTWFNCSVKDDYIYNMSRKIILYFLRNIMFLKIILVILKHDVIVH